MANDVYLGRGTDVLRFRLEFTGRAGVEQAQEIYRVLKDVDEHDYVQRTWLHSLLTAALLLTDPEGAAEAAAEAERYAELAQKPVSRAWSLLAQASLDLSPEKLFFRLECAREIRDIALEHGDDGYLETTYFLLLGALLEIGELTELDEELCLHGPTLIKFPQLEDSRFVSWFRCIRATLDGHTDTAEEFAKEGFDRALLADDTDAEIAFIAQLAVIRWLDGRGSEMEASLLKARQKYPGEPIWTSILAWIWIQQGRVSAARGIVQSLAPLEQWPKDQNWLAAVSNMAIVHTELRNLDVLEEFHQALLPHAKHLAAMGVGITAWGTVADSLAVVADLQGNQEQAIEHYRTAIDLCARIGAQPWLAASQLGLASLLLRRLEAGDRAEAEALAQEAAATGKALGLHQVEDESEQIISALRSGTIEAAPKGRQPQAGQPKIRVMGGFEVAATDGTISHWQSRKAREALKILVARRGVAIAKEAVMEILWPKETPERVANRFSVAISTVRRALDPVKRFAPDHFLVVDADLLRLRLDRLTVDVEVFLRRANAALAKRDGSASSIAQMVNALQLYTGDVFPDEVDVGWAERLQNEARSCFFTLAHSLAEDATEAEEHFTSVETYRRILDIDPYDQKAHEGLINAFTLLGAHGQAKDATLEYQQRMAEVGFEEA